MRHESDLKTFLTALVLAAVCSFLVAGANVLLKPRQDMNKSVEIKKNILAAGGYLEPNTDVNKAFSQVETYIVDMKTGDAVKGDAGSYFQNIRKLASSADAVKLTKQQDLAVIKSIPAKIPVFVTRQNGKLGKIIVPIYGSGLWSTMYGFMALDSDLNTVSGITFYEHGETPGLGGEIDNPLWKAGWVNKKIYDNDGSVALSVVKGGAKGDNQVDSLSGATMTSRGVENTVRFWMGPDGYGKYFNKLKKGGE